MNIEKHMEGIFVVTLGLVWAGTLAIDLMPRAAATQPATTARFASYSSGCACDLAVKRTR